MSCVPTKGHSDVWGLCCSLSHVDVCGPCCCQEPYRCEWLVLPPEAIVLSGPCYCPGSCLSPWSYCSRVYIDFHGLCYLQNAMQMSVVWTADWSHDDVHVCAALWASHVWTPGSTAARVCTNVSVCASTKGQWISMPCAVAWFHVNVCGPCWWGWGEGHVDMRSLCCRLKLWWYQVVSAACLSWL